MKERHMDMLLKAIGEVELSEGELRSLEWVAGWETETIENICSVILKIGESVIVIGSLSNEESEAK